MTRENSFKVLSYLTDFIEKQLNLEPCSFKSVANLNEVLNIERLGFKKLKNINDEDIINLYTVTGRQLLFKKSEHYKNYFEWYTENVTFDEVKNIYSKCDIDFYDLIYIGEEKENNNLKLIKTKTK